MTLEYYDQRDNFVGALDVEITAEDIADCIIDVHSSLKARNLNNLYKVFKENKKLLTVFTQELIDAYCINIDELEKDEDFKEFMLSKYADELDE